MSLTKGKALPPELRAEGHTGLLPAGLVTASSAGSGATCVTVGLALGRGHENGAQKK